MTFAAIIEWPSDAIEPPALIIGPSVESLFPHVIEALQGLCDDAYVDEADFIANHPYPSPTDIEGQRAWLLAMREATTAPWVELYIMDGPRATHVPLNIIQEAS